MKAFKGQGAPCKVVKTPVPCTCRGSICRNTAGDKVARVFRCAGCKRFVPWCFGAADDLPDHCDDCWAKRHEAA